jgi:disulfide bond formation protein DsbB
MTLQDILDHPRAVPSAIVLACAAALGTALAAETWGGIQPCVLCIYQRYAYLGAFVFGLLALALGHFPALRRLLVAGAGLAFLAGAAIAAFHVGVEQHWWRGTAECHAPALDLSLSPAELRQQMLETHFVPCDQIPWSLFGISLAGYNFLASLALAAAALYAAWRGGRRTSP